jgi:uncharacterized protein YbaR (Trm112 family)
MTVDPALENLLACPRCADAPLECTQARIHCDSCGRSFPLIDGVPWLFDEPGAALAEWRSRVRFTLQTLEREQTLYARAGAAPSIGERTRERLQLLAAGSGDQRGRLEALLAPLGQGGLTADYASNAALRARVPADQGLMTYAYNIHRDWAWGKDENEASFEIVRAALKGHRPGRTLVLGAGAGRTAYDIHMRTASELTVMLDFNPYLVLVAKRVSSGGTVELYEFPLEPRRIGDHAVLRTLAAEGPCRAGLHFVLADALNPPFADEQFDTVVTPWLVDILPEPFERLCGRVNALLAPGGRWVNFGTLSFRVADPALRYGAEECAEIIAAAGFESPDMVETSLPYLCSPASRHGRREQVVSWGAVKRERTVKPPRHQPLPDWLVRNDVAVPQLESFESQALSNRIRAFILSLIDGRRSLKDMADVFVQQQLMGHGEAEASIRAYLVKLYESEQRR